MSDLSYSQASVANNADNATSNSTLQALQRLIDVVAQLRNPDGGCPWDLAQTAETLTPYVIEEAYEVVDAIQGGQPADIAEELGDLLLQVVLQAQIAREQGQFDLKQIADGIAEKLVRRHPHVFGDQVAESVDDVRRNWEQIKAEEKAGVEDPAKLTPKLARYARSLPPLMASMKISKKAAKAGFEWDDIEGVWDKFHEELEEFRTAIAHEPQENQEAELGDLLFTLVNIARWHDLDPAAALQGTNRRFIQRFGLVESVATRPLEEYSIEELEELWQKAKAKIRAERQQS